MTCSSVLFRILSSCVFLLLLEFYLVLECYLDLCSWQSAVEKRGERRTETVRSGADGAVPWSVRTVGADGAVPADGAVSWSVRTVGADGAVP